MESISTVKTHKVRATQLSALVVDEDASTRDLCINVGSQMGLKMLSASTTEQGLVLLAQFTVNILITDLNVPQLGGMELLNRVRTRYSHIAVVVLTQYGTIEPALLQCSPVGAIDHICKPVHLEELRNKLAKLVCTLETSQEKRQSHTQFSLSGMTGASPKMQHVYELIEKVSMHNFPVLILGESGTGKEMVARSIHFSSSRRHMPFVPVDCAALVSTLMETELFGYVKGAFTGAQNSRVGLLESADGGTLFLDEIGDMPFELQAKLLRVLQEREVRPVGATNRVRIDIRVIAATNRDLEMAIRTGDFRQDLYFRLNVVQIKTPPLREHKSDIPLLVNVFLEKFRDSQRPVCAISEAAICRLMTYDWPGNVRELENAVECAMALGSGLMLDIGDLPSNVQHTSCENSPDQNELLDFEHLRHRAIMRAMEETGGDKLAAARLLGIGKTTLYRKLKEFAQNPFPN